MAERLYATEPVVRSAIDHCAEVLAPVVGQDLRRLLFPRARERTKAADQLLHTEWAQPALFTVEYAIGALWRSWGLQPAAMIGHSVGEYVAATLAGVMALGRGGPAATCAGRLRGSRRCPRRVYDDSLRRRSRATSRSFDPRQARRSPERLGLSRRLIVGRLSLARIAS